jgi:hypothetical protein
LILRDHPCHSSLLIHAERSDRIQRLCSLYTITAQEAEKMIEANDSTFTKQGWLDACWYDLCLNVSSLGVEPACEVSLAAIRSKLGP